MLTSTVLSHIKASFYFDMHDTPWQFHLFSCLYIFSDIFSLNLIFRRPSFITTFELHLFLLFKVQHDITSTFFVKDYDLIIFAFLLLFVIKASFWATVLSTSELPTHQYLSAFLALPLNSSLNKLIIYKSLLYYIIQRYGCAKKSYDLFFS